MLFIIASQNSTLNDLLPFLAKLHCLPVCSLRHGKRNYYIVRKMKCMSVPDLQLLLFKSVQKNIWLRLEKGKDRSYG